MANSNFLSTPALGSRRAQTVSASETPLKQNMSSTNVFINGNLEEQRKAVREDLGPIPEVTVDFMLEHLIPDSKVNIGRTMKALEKTEGWSRTNGWRSFGTKSPSELSSELTNSNVSKNTDKNNHETQIFSRMKLVYQSIVSNTQFHDRETPTPTLSFEQSPNSAPRSNTNVRSKPDGYGVLTTDQKIHSSRAKREGATSSKTDADYETNGKGKISKTFANKVSDTVNWHDIACAEEYKVNSGIKDINDNVEKITWSLHHIMHNDHRRRFTFGLTIEDENVRIWFACRQMVVVSRPFNFRTDAEQFVYAIASLIYATPTQLGYDPTMRLKWRPNGWFYDIKVTTKRPDGSDHTVLYSTIDVLSNTAYNIRGRATRVYLANISTEDKNDPFSFRRVVLKDSWIDVDRPKEGDTLSELLEGASDDEKALFLTIHQHGIVQIDRQDDSTQHILKGQKIEIPKEGNTLVPKKFDRWTQQLLGKALGAVPETAQAVPKEQVAPANDVGIFYLFTPPAAAKPKSSTSKGDRRSGSTQHSSDALPHNTFHKRPKPIVYSPKVHYRIAFEEVGESLMHIANSGKLSPRILGQALRKTTLALKYMAKKGYVHRDVSAGNIIIFKDQAKLSDLEFAKKYGAVATSYVRTGTYSFMPGEVMKGKYSVTLYAEQNANQPFVHNPIHDLESLWWVGVWCLMWHYPAPFTGVTYAPSSNSKAPKRATKKEYVYREFNDKERSHIELLRLQGEQLFPSYPAGTEDFRMEEIHSQINYSSRDHDDYPEVMGAIVLRLNLIRQCISWAYSRIQRSLPRTESSYFVNDLRIPNPADGMKYVYSDNTEDEGVIPVHDRIMEMLELNQQETDIEDAIMWPLESIEEYSKWLPNRETLDKLRPRKHLTYGYTNMDANAGYHEY